MSIDVFEKVVQRTGPVILLDCYSCEGVGRPNCEKCKGTGKLVRDVQPFVTLEALGEQIEALQVALKMTFEDLYEGKPPIGSPTYHLRAIARYQQSLFQQLVHLLPEEYSRTEGE